MVSGLLNSPFLDYPWLLGFPKRYELRSTLLVSQNDMDLIDIRTLVGMIQLIPIYRTPSPFQVGHLLSITLTVAHVGSC